MARALEVLRGDCRVEAGDGRAWALHTFLLRARSADLADGVPASETAMSEPGVLPFVLPLAPPPPGASGAPAAPSTGVILFRPGPVVEATIIAALAPGHVKPSGASSALAFGRLDRHTGLLARSRFARAESEPETPPPMLTRRESCDGFSEDEASDTEADNCLERATTAAVAGAGAGAGGDEDQDPTSLGARERLLVEQRLHEAANADAAADAEARIRAPAVRPFAAAEEAGSVPTGAAGHIPTRRPAPLLVLSHQLAGRAAAEFVSYLYTGRCTVRGSVVLALARAAHEYSLPLLLAGCEMHLIRRCTSADAATAYSEAAKELYMPRLHAYAAIVRSSVARAAVAAGDWESAFPSAAAAVAASARQRSRSTRGGASTLTASASASAATSSQHTSHPRSSVPESPVVGLAALSGGFVPDFSLDGGLPSLPADASDSASEASARASPHGDTPGSSAASDTGGASPLPSGAEGAGGRGASGGAAGSAWGRRSSGGGAVSARAGYGRPVGGPVTLAERLQLEQAAEAHRREARRHARWVASQGAGWAANVAAAGTIAPAPPPAAASTAAGRRLLVPAGVRIAAAAAAGSTARAAAAGPEVDSSDSDSDDNSEDSDMFF